MNTFTKILPGRNTSVRRAIERMTDVSRDHLTPELALRLVTPGCPMWTARHDECPFQDPFWAFYWPGGQALTRYVLDKKSVVRGRKVLDLGSGCGAAAIAAARFGGAASVTANDIDPVAAVAIEINASLNSCKKEKLNVTTENMIGKSNVAANYDFILVGDMFYDESFMDLLMVWLLQSLYCGTQVLIGDPGRNPRFFEHYGNYLEKVGKYINVNDHMKTNGLSGDDINVWRLVNKR